ncbi:MAG: hypothetical protein AAF560_20540 [Acidobacteriota bacterium]
MSQNLYELSARVRVPPVPPPTQEECIERLGYVSGRPETLPFLGGDATAGSETELQAVVTGTREQVDLPRAIESSRYLANLRRRIGAGEASAKWLEGLEAYLDDNPDQVWENSWVRLPLDRLSRFARYFLDNDLRSTQANPQSGAAAEYRSDIERFLSRDRGEACLRIPVSYLLRLSLVDAIADLPLAIRAGGLRLTDYLLNDHTSPETSSLRVVNGAEPGGLGQALAKETSRRFLLTHLLAHYANRKLGLTASGQTVGLFFSPSPPTRQRLLNDSISDSFYRELFASPCLGWSDGETKHRYMLLCHQALSRSALNAVGKMREAGIINNNLVVLPSVSNLSLANNGVHISLGSRHLTGLMAAGADYTERHEKYLGDLVIKIFEHFLPLFVGTYSAAPSRLAFHDFHPERALGFLPHELDYTHLRMLWRRWRKKAKNRFLGRSITPFGPPAIDSFLGRLFWLQGDFVPDGRLADYPVALLSTDTSPSLDGTLGNGPRLAKDLDDLGVFDRRMSLYLPCKLREYRTLGFSGFEGRHYSQFHRMKTDLARATELQQLLIALAFRYAAEGQVRHEHIPDNPELESERRQIFFGRALGVPTFFVRENTTNRFLHDLISSSRGTRRSRRYRGFQRIRQADYQRALLERIERDATDLAEMLGCRETLADLRQRLDDPRTHAAAGKLTQEILDTAGARSPFELCADEWNTAAEQTYRDRTRQGYLEEALDFFAEDLESLAANGMLPEGVEPAGFLAQKRDQVSNEHLSVADTVTLIRLFLQTLDRDRAPADAEPILSDLNQITFDTDTFDPDIDSPWRAAS